MSGTEVQGKLAQIAWPQRILMTILVVYFCSFLLLENLDSESLVVLVLWGLALLAVPRWRVSTTGEEKRIWLVFALMFVVVLASWGVAGFPEEGERMADRFARFLLFVPVYLVMRRYAQPWMLWWAVLCGLLVAGSWGIGEYLGIAPELHEEAKRSRVSGAVNPIHYGMLMLLMTGLLAAGGGYFRSLGKFWFGLALFASFLGLLGCLMSLSRGAWFYLPVWGLLVLWGIRRQQIFSTKALVGMLAGVIILAAVVLPFTVIPAKIQVTWAALQAYQESGAMLHRSETHKGVADVSVGTRLEMWQAAWQLFLENPVLGVGPGGFKRASTELFERGDTVEHVLYFSHPHNEYLDFMASMGTAGLIALLAVYLMPLMVFIRALRSDRDEVAALGLAGTLVVVGYLHYGVTSSLLERTTMMGFYLVTMGVILSLIFQRRDASETGAQQSISNRTPQ